MRKASVCVRLHCLTLAVAALGVVCPELTAQSNRFRELWSEPAIATRIDEGIRANRTAWAALHFTDSRGRALTGVSAEIRQVSSDFLFGINAFMVGGFESSEENRRYGDRIAELFNYATAPFYWKTLEPEPGRLRFDSGSEKIYRRPPPDVVLEFCRRNAIILKGHPLVWDNPRWHHPEWAPTDSMELMRLIRRRIEQISDRYRDKIHYWDVVNEAMYRHLDVAMPVDYVFRSFQVAAASFPVDSTLILNETTSVWRDYREEMSPFYLLAQNLLLRGAKLDALGFQCHFFSEPLWGQTLAGDAMRPRDLFAVLDQYSTLGRPIHITEITIPTLPNSSDGAKAQAEVVRNFYRLWFSHPSVEAITWWNLVDETAAPGEDKWRGGLLGRDFSEKPVWKVLHQLLLNDWRTRLSLKSGNASSIQFRGFFGTYEVTAQIGDRHKTVQFRLEKGRPNRLEIQL